MATDNRPPIPQDMVNGILRALVPPMLAYVAAKGWIPESSVGDVLAALSAAGAAIWSVYNKTDTAKIAAVEAIPDVAKIVAVPNPDPTGAMADAVADSARPKVTNSIGVSAPMSTPSTQRR